MAGFGGSIKLTGETAYKQAIKEITDNLTLLSSEMKVVSSAYDRNDKSTENLASQNEILNKRLDEQNKRLAEAKKMLDQAKTSTDSNAQTVAKWQNEVNKAQAEVNNTTRIIKNNTAQIEANEKALNDNNDELKTMAKNEQEAGQSAITMGDLIKANVISEVIIGGFKKLGSAIASVTKEFVNFVKDGVQNASDLTEAQNVVDTVFKDSAETINQFAKDAGVSFGMTQLAVKNYAGSMGAMLTSMGMTDEQVLSMSQSLVGLAGDMASFYNLDHDTAWQKIRSGIAGETEPLKQLGINMSVANLEAYAMSQGITTLYKDMSQSEQTLLRYNYLMQQTANAQGDFAKTSDSFANQQKILALQFENLSTNIGTYLLPTLTTLMQAFNGAMSGTITFKEAMTQIADVIVGFANSLMEKLPVLLETGASMLQTLIQGIIEAIPTLMPAVTEVISSLLIFLVEQLPAIVNGGIQIILAVVKGIANAIPALVPAIVEAVINIVTTLMDNIDLIINAGMELIIGLAQGLIDAIPVLVDKIPQIISSIISALINYYPQIISAGIQLMVQLAIGLVSAIPQIVMAIPQIIRGIIQGFMDGIGKMKDVGINLLKGLWQGMWSWAGQLWENIKNLGKSIVGWFQDIFGIHSPSTVFADKIGKNLALGIGEGFEDTMGRVKDDMANSIPTDFNITATTTAQGSATAFDAMVEAFKSALKGVNIILDDEVAGRFVTDTVEKVVYS